MRAARHIGWGLLVAVALCTGSCGIYSPYGAQTSGASTYSVAAFEMLTPLATASSSLALTEALRDRIQRQSTLRLVTKQESFNLPVKSPPGK